MIVIDGIFFTRTMTGVQRVANCLVRELDRIAEPGQFQLLIPAFCPVPEGFTRIEVVRFGHCRGYLWEQVDLALYLARHRAVGLFFENAVPVLYRRGVTYLHDISMRVNPEFWRTGCRGRISECLWRIMYRAIMDSEMQMVTVSAFSRSEISRVYGVPEARIAVIPCGWQHMNNIEADPGVLERLHLERRGYFFAMATAAANKNQDWILRAAAANPQECFVIAGKGTERLMGTVPANLRCIGYVSDREAKALMGHCRAFLFPSLYEGFGLPPLEALASGAEYVVVSDIPVLREVYGDAAVYVDPRTTWQVPDRESEQIPGAEVRAALLGRYSWAGSAEQLLRLCEREDGRKV
ncbi:MAG: glycosyltransferase family 4 protein [Clostridia bacterium]|nr:glycosyltransferase family 4 protein [Clostridia bacterium]